MPCVLAQATLNLSQCQFQRTPRQVTIGQFTTPGSHICLIVGYRLLVGGVKLTDRLIELNEFGSSLSINDATAFACFASSLYDSTTPKPPSCVERGLLRSTRPFSLKSELSSPTCSRSSAFLHSQPFMAIRYGLYALRMASIRGIRPLRTHFAAQFFDFRALFLCHKGTS